MVFVFDWMKDDRFLLSDIEEEENFDLEELFENLE